MYVGALQCLILERRAGEVRIDLRLAGDQRRRRIRVREADRDIVELLEVIVPEHLGGFDLQCARLEPDTRRRDGDPVLVGEVLEALHVRVIGQQIVGHRPQRGDGLDVLLATGPIPDRQHRRNARRHHIQGTRQQGLVHGRCAGNAVPVHLDIEALGLAMFLDQLLVTHHVEDQVANAKLLGDADLAFGVGQGIEQRSGRQGNQQGERRTLESHGLVNLTVSGKD